MEIGATYEAQMLRAIHEIDQTLKLVKYTYETEGERNPLPRLKERALLPPALVFDVSVVNPRGGLVASTRGHESEKKRRPGRAAGSAEQRFTVDQSSLEKP
ncbi:hypothetical protein LOY66_17455 [Pseudomonas viciae]|nr:hypothetical protein [Pseudomonas viciae]UZE84392.1 hypothetical protein LOY66_17455 [Pseudomonas viciae]